MQYLLQTGLEDVETAIPRHASAHRRTQHCLLFFLQVIHQSLTKFL